jgi:PPK2 family polyphosphate:nucleotide phosphotransferase
MTKYIDELRFGKESKLTSFKTDMNLANSKSNLKEKLEDLGKELSKIQDIMYAHNRYGVLVIIQGMDTSGKDGLVREVFKHFNPRGTVVHTFKVPTIKELQHDYLWRHYIALPERGKFAIFNRSHYENVLVTRVNPEFLLNENLSDILSVEDVTMNFWEERFKQIINFEEHIARNGTIVIKFYLHLSKDEQKKRLLDRLNNSDKNWKFNKGDLVAREKWDMYMEYYEEAMQKTSKDKAPWYIIPADDKTTARCIVAEVLLETMKTYTDIKEPTLSDEELALFNEYRNTLKKQS